MKVKKFEARTFAEALELVKKELSEDAIILSTEERKGLKPCVEVTAAVDYEISDPVDNRTDDVKVKREKSNYQTQTPNGSYGSLAEEIREEVRTLRDMIESMKDSGFEISLPMKKKMIFGFLKERSFSDEFALRICESTEDVDAITCLIEENIKVRDKVFDRKAIMLLGPTGVGKTTTVAKLSANAIKEGKKVGIISFDTYRIGAVEQVRIYARIMGIPLSIVSNINEFRESVCNFAGSRDVVFIDTAGRNPTNEAYIAQLSEILNDAHDSKESSDSFSLELHLLVSANYDYEFMKESQKFYSRLPIDCIAFTKVDEAVRFGSLYNLTQIYQKPVAYITTGQNVPNDIEFISKDKLANLILRKGFYSLDEQHA